MEACYNDPLNKVILYKSATPIQPKIACMPVQKQFNNSSHLLTFAA